MEDAMYINPQYVKVNRFMEMYWIKSEFQEIWMNTSPDRHTVIKNIASKLIGITHRYRNKIIGENYK